MDRRERAARNEALFREVNERIEEVNLRFGTREGGFVCECGDPECSATVELTLEEYEGVRAEGDRFFVVPGHETNGVERVVQAGERFAVVEKIGLAGEVAEELDPRANG